MKKTFRHSKFTAVFTDEDGYFSFTGDVSKSGGAVGDKIAEIDPRFTLMEAMHLSDAKTGEPMHAMENGKYHAKLGNVEMLARLWRIQIEAAKTICHAVSEIKDKRSIKIDEIIENAIIGLGLKAKWFQEAKEVRKLAKFIPANLLKGFIYPMNDDGSPLNKEYENVLDQWDDETRDKIIALAKFEDVDVLEVVTGNAESNEFEVSGKMYLVLTDEEADEKAADYIRESLWAFNADFLASYTGMPAEMFEAVQPQCEGANDAIMQCVERTGSVEDFAQQAVRADGRGHFLSPYDGREDEETVDDETYYIYRQ